MSEATPETAPAEETAQPQEGESKTFTEDYVKELRAEIAKYRTRAKTAEGEIENVRQTSMTEAERAIAEAEQRGRTAVLADFGQKLARSAFVAEAARRNPGFDAAAVLDDLNIARYVGEDGEPDSKSIAAAVARLVPEPAGNPRPVGDADLGTRSIPPALNSDSLERALRQKLGIT